MDEILFGNELKLSKCIKMHSGVCFVLFWFFVFLFLFHSFDHLNSIHYWSSSVYYSVLLLLGLSLRYLSSVFIVTILSSVSLDSSNFKPMVS